MTLIALVAACARPVQPAPQNAVATPSASASSLRAEPAPPNVLQDYERVELAALHVSPGVSASSIEPDASVAGHRVLRVRYQCAAEPPNCDIWQQLGGADWRGARALRFRIRTEKPLSLSTSFIDGNGVGYTVRTDATHGGDWEELIVPIEHYRPNQYFQPPDAKTGSPLDLQHVRAFGFCPLDAGPGTFAIDEVGLDR